MLIGVVDVKTFEEDAYINVCILYFIHFTVNNLVKGLSFSSSLNLRTSYTGDSYNTI